MCLQVGEVDADHSQLLRAELDNQTPRTAFFTLPPGAPGADLLFQQAAAFAATAMVLQDNPGSEDLAVRCEHHSSDGHFAAVT